MTIQTAAKNKRPYGSFLLCASAIFMLGACSSTAQHSGDMTKDDKINAAIERAAHSSGANQSLSYLEKNYKRNSDDAVAAASYARALRLADSVNQAALVLAPFANMGDDSPAVAKSEYAAILLAQGNHKSAENYAQKAILQDENNHRAYHYLAIALDAQGEHEKAERAMRKGLDIWQGDPTPIMNNLALNLASQGFLDEAHDILLKAKALAPGRIEVERNLRIVMALKQSNFVDTRKPVKKPKAPVKKAAEKAPEKAPEKTPDAKEIPKKANAKADSKPAEQDAKPEKEDKLGIFKREDPDSGHLTRE